eukprot:1186449-Prorocentrum_minimum.AAC.2
MSYDGVRATDALSIPAAGVALALSEVPPPPLSTACPTPSAGGEFATAGGGSPPIWINPSSVSLAPCVVALNICAIVLNIRTAALNVRTTALDIRTTALNIHTTALDIRMTASP